MISPFPHQQEALQETIDDEATEKEMEGKQNEINRCR